MEGVRLPVQVVVYGAGGFGREVAWLVESLAQTGESFQVAALVQDGSSGLRINGYEVRGLEEAREAFPDAGMVVAVGDPQLRKRLSQRAADAGFQFVTLVAPTARFSRWITIGEGTIICAGATLTTNVRVGRHVQVNLACTVGHDVVLEDFATLLPGAHVSGRVHIGEGAVLGTGASIINGTSDKPLMIGEDAVIGAGSCVTRDVAPGETVFGVPARAIARKSDQ